MRYLLECWNGGAWNVEKELRQRGAFTKYITNKFPEMTKDIKAGLKKVIESAGTYQFGYISTIYRVKVYCKY